MGDGGKKLRIPDALGEVLASLGITGMQATTWSLNVTERDCSLNLVWRRADEKEQNQCKTRGNVTDLLTDSTMEDFCEVNSCEDIFSKEDGKHVEPNESARNFVSKFSGSYLDSRAEIREDKKVVELNCYYSGMQRKAQKIGVAERKVLQMSADGNTEPNESRDCRNLQEQSGHHSRKAPLHSNDHHRNNLRSNNSFHANNRSHANKATCSCGEEFNFKEKAIKHILFSCPVSLCFRIDLDIRIHDVIGQWRDEQQRILGRKWWHAYKTSGVPDIMGTYAVASVDQLEGMINEFIAKAGTNDLFDKNKNWFVLMRGLEELPYELAGMIGHNR